MELDRVERRLTGLAKRVLKTEVELASRARNRRFYCAALAGEPVFNLSVNSDMTCPGYSILPPHDH